jgi:hypothetical protein
MAIAGYIIDGPDSAWPHSVVAKDASTGRAAVDAAKQAGGDESEKRWRPARRGASTGRRSPLRVAFPR